MALVSKLSLGEYSDFVNIHECNEVKNFNLDHTVVIFPLFSSSPPKFPTEHYE